MIEGKQLIYALNDPSGRKTSFWTRRTAQQRSPVDERALQDKDKDNHAISVHVSLDTAAKCDHKQSWTHEVEIRKYTCG